MDYVYPDEQGPQPLKVVSTGFVEMIVISFIFADSGYGQEMEDDANDEAATRTKRRAKRN